MPAWNGWYHIIGSTYGNWLPGDGRGWRTRHHREHIEGDYKNPPPTGTHDRRLAHAKSVMKREPILLSPPQRHLVCHTMVAALQFHKIEVKDLAVSPMHFHLLAGFALVRRTAYLKNIRDPTRHFVGITKSRSSRALSGAGTTGQGGIWAKRTKIVPIDDRGHFDNVVQYILDHAQEGAFVWSMRNGE